MCVMGGVCLPAVAVPVVAMVASLNAVCLPTTNYIAVARECGTSQHTTRRSPTVTAQRTRARSLADNCRTYMPASLYTHRRIWAVHGWTDTVTDRRIRYVWHISQHFHYFYLFFSFYYIRTLRKVSWIYIR